MSESKMIDLIQSSSTSATRVLMCRPEYFDVVYEINSFMEGNCGQADVSLARRQWENLLAAVREAGAEVEFVDPKPKLPDLVFTANGGLVFGRKVVLPRFAHPERRGEEKYFREWFEREGFELVEVPEREYFEGEGDVVVRDRFLFMGSHSRTSRDAARTLERVTGLEVVTLQLDPKGYYHLDTCMFSDGASGNLFYCPEAFTPADRKTIESRIDSERRVEITLKEAASFACNTVIVGRTAISPLAPDSFASKVSATGLRSVMVDLSEFLKAGGAAKCLILMLSRP